MEHAKTDLEKQIELLNKMDVTFERFDNPIGETEIRIKSPAWIDYSCISWNYKDGKQTLFTATTKGNEFKKIN